jgi:Glutaredoxin-like domain (DUF836)
LRRCSGARLDLQVAHRQTSPLIGRGRSTCTLLDCLASVRGMKALLGSRVWAPHCVQNVRRGSTVVCSASRKLVLYSKPGCHLCDGLKVALPSHRSESFEILTPSVAWRAAAGLAKHVFGNNKRGSAGVSLETGTELQCTGPNFCSLSS